jgi:hypothetical protein
MMESNRPALQGSSSTVTNELTVEQYLTQQCDLLIKVCGPFISVTHYALALVFRIHCLRTSSLCYISRGTLNSPP